MDISKLLADPLPTVNPGSFPANGSSATASTSSKIPRGKSSSASRMNSHGSRSSAATEKSKRRTCDICGHSFVSRAHLAIHDRTVHQRLKLYQCDICKTSFGQPGTLTRHKAAVHEKRRDHMCSFPNCGKRFGSRWTLSVHERNVHEKIKPFSCSYPNCDRQFGNLWNQKKHEAQIHNMSDKMSRANHGRTQADRQDQTSFGEGCGPPRASTEKNPSGNYTRSNSHSNRPPRGNLEQLPGTFYDVRRDFVRKNLD